MSPFDDTPRVPEQQEFAREGAFDAQLLFPTPETAAPEPLARIRKRDGRLVAFERGKVAEAIRRAAERARQADAAHADGLANAVAIYLAKTAAGRPPTVDEVSDAVERVLIELGHGDTALAFARYRDKRARIRELRNGNLQSLLHELEEAQAGGPGPAGAMTLFVRTSDEALAEWDAEKIVEALVRETRLDEARARLVAAEVERQILHAGVGTLTASLVRELVDAKLVEHGLEEFRRRHSRLGVPLYDAERIICVPNRDENVEAQDPVGTDLELAERVKREFALAHVYAQDVADAHLRCDIHLDHVGFVDRLEDGELSLNDVGGILTGLGASRPEAFLTELGRFRTALAAHVAGPLRWTAADAALGTLGAGLDTESLRQLALVTVAALTPPTRAFRRAGGHAEVQLGWLTGSAAGGSQDPTARAAYALIQAFHDLEQPAVEPLVLALRLDPATLTDGPVRRVLRRVSELAAGGRRVRFVQAPTHAGAGPGTPLLETATLGRAVLNLPRVAYGAPDVDSALARIDALVEVAARALVQKRDFLERLLGVRSFGPLGFLQKTFDGRAVLALHSARAAIEVTGLGECVQTLTGAAPAAEGHSLEVARRIAARVAEACDRFARAYEVPIRAGACNAPAAAERFAIADLRAHPEDARAVLRPDPVTQDLRYTPGVSLPADAAATPFERVGAEARIHDALTSNGGPMLPLIDPDLSPQSVCDFVTNVFRHTSCRELVIAP